MAIAGIAVGIAQIAGLIKAGRDKYNESTSVKEKVEKLVSGIDKVADKCGKFLSEKGVKLKDFSKKAGRKARDKAREYKGKSMKEVFKTTADDLTRTFEETRAKLTGDKVSANEMEDLNSDNTSVAGPPITTEGEGGFLKGIFANIKEMNDARKNKEVDGDADPDGEDSERAILKEIAASLAKGGVGKEKEEPSFLTRFKNRVQGRKDEVEAEKQRLRDKAKKGNKKGFLEKLLSNPLLWLAGIIIAPLRKLASWVVGGITSKFAWLAKKIASGTGRMLWWVGKKLVKGLWWGLKSVGKGLGKIITKITPKWIKNGLGKLTDFAKGIKSGIGKLGEIFKTGLGDLASKMGGWFKNLGSSIAQKGGGLLKSAWGGLKSLGSAVFGKGGIVRTAATVVGKAAVHVGGRILAGIVAVGPVGWVIGIGLALWGAYALYKYFKEGKGKFPDSPAGDLSLLRMYSYGLTYNESNNFTKIFELEEVTGRFLRFDKNRSEVIMSEPDEQGNKDISNILGLSETEYGPFEQSAMEWYSKRFLPSYKEYLRCLWLIDDAKKAGEIDGLTRNELAVLAYNYNVPSGVWAVKNLPFQDTPTSTVTIESYNELLLSVRKELSKEWQDEQARKSTSKDNDIKAKNSGGITQVKNNDSRRTYSPDNEEQSSNGMGFEGDGGGSQPLDSGLQSVLDGKGLRYGGGGASYSPYSNKLSGDPYNGSSYGSGDSGGGGGGYQRQYGNLPDYQVGTGSGTIGNTLAPISLDKAFSDGSKITGMPEQLLWTFAKLESGLNPRAKAKTSTASGLFQFINATWRSMVKTHGHKYGMSLSNSNPFNPMQNILMGAEYMKHNMTYIKGYRELGLDLGTALYLAHFLGSGGVRRLFKAMRANPNAPIQSAISSSQYRANRSLLKGLTIRQFVDKMRDRLANVMNTPAGKYAGYRNHRQAMAALYNGSPNDMGGDIESYGDGTGGKESNSSALSEGGGVYAAFEASSNGDYSGPMDSNGNPIGGDASSGGTSGNSFIDSILSGNGASLKDINSSSGPATQNSSYTPYGFGESGNSDGGGSWSGANASDYNGKKEVLGEDYANGSGGVSIHPIKKGYPFYFSSLFGPRNIEVPGASKDHAGVDIGVPTKKPGTPIVATGNGKVWRSYTSSTYGEVIYILHPDGLQTRYAHLAKRMLGEGQEVAAGDLVGYMGSTGIGNGVHLHFEVRKGHGQYSRKIDPFEFPVIKNSYKGYKVTTVIEDNNGKEEVVSEENKEETKNNNADGFTLQNDQSRIQVDPVTGNSNDSVLKDFSVGMDTNETLSVSSAPPATTSTKDESKGVAGDDSPTKVSPSDNKIQVDLDSTGMENKQSMTNDILKEIAELLRTQREQSSTGPSFQQQAVNINNNSKQGINFNRR